MGAHNFEPRARPLSLRDGRLFAPGSDEPSLALGFLAALPLLLAYELSISSDRIVTRNVAELLLSLPLWPLGDMAAALRVVALLGAGVAAGVLAKRSGIALLPGLARTLGEGLLVAITLGPVLLAIQVFLGSQLDLPRPFEGGPRQAPELVWALFLFGSGGYEELVFRVGVLSACYLAVRHAASFLGAPLAGARFAAEIGGVVGSSLLFAAMHLEAFTGWMGWRGEPFELGAFFWRFLAGVLLATLVRWRGLGVGAWGHGLYNLAIVLGAGPGVFG